MTERQIARPKEATPTSIVKKLKSISAGDRTLLDNCMIVYGAGLQTAIATRSRTCPPSIAGQGGKTIESGRRVVCREKTPMSNLFISMMDRMNVPVEQFPDSTGRAWTDSI